MNTLFGFSSKSCSNLYNFHFFILSCIVNFFTYSLAYFILPEIGHLVAIFGSLFILGLLINFYIKKPTEKEQYNNRYICKVVFGQFVISLAVFYINKDFILFFPILMGMLYLNVNTIIKSKLIQLGSICLFTMPFWKILFFDNVVNLEYVGTISAFMIVSFITTILFRTNKNQLEEAEQTRLMFKTVHELTTQLVNHDVRNELQKMQCLGLKKYRGDSGLFFNTMNEYMQSIEKIVKNNVFDEISELNICDIISSLNHITNNKNITFKYVNYGDCKLFGTKSMVYSVLKNLIENSIEAGYRKNIKTNILISKNKNKITIVDNCGGFDIENIQYGKSSKGDSKKHGIFLKTITNPAMKNMFGFETVLTRTENGMVIVLTFKASF